MMVIVLQRLERYVLPSGVSVEVTLVTSTPPANGNSDPSTASANVAPATLASSSSKYKPLLIERNV